MSEASAVEGSDREAKKSARAAAIRRFLERDGAARLEVSLSPHAADALRRLAAFGVSGDSPEVAQMYASRLLEQALENLGDDPVEGIQQMSPQESKPVTAGTLAPDAIVLEEEGAQTPLSAAWKDGPAVLVFLRHYG